MASRDAMEWGLQSTEDPTMAYEVTTAWKGC